MDNLINIAKSTTLRNKGKIISIALILILGLSTALTMNLAKAAISVTTYGANVNHGVTTPPATIPGQLTYFGGGYQIVEPTQAQIANWSLPAVTPDLEFTVAPDPIGVGQQVSLVYGLWNIPNVISGSVNGVSTGSYGGWGALQLIIKDPNGTIAYQADPPNTLTATSGSETSTFVPDTVGNWSITVNWLGEIVVNCSLTTMPNWNCYFQPISRTISLTVQQSPIQGFNEAPVPTRTQYWTMPICALNRGWNVLNGPWLTECYNATTKFNPYTYAPDSAHILWNVNLGPCMGGNVGGAYGPEDFPYWQCWSSSLGSLAASPITQYPESYVEVMNGYMYCNGPSSYPMTNTSVIQCRSVFTGQLLWTVPGAENAAQLCNFVNVNIKSAIPMLWYIMGTSWFCYDANTGKEMLQVTGCTSPTVINQIYQGPVNPQSATTTGFDGGGDLLVFTAGTNSSSTGTWVCEWSANTFFAVTNANGNQWSWPGQAFGVNFFGKSYPWKNGVVWNVTSIAYPGAAIREYGDASNGDPTILMEVTCTGLATPINSHYTVAYPWTSFFYALNMTNGKMIWNSSLNAPPFTDQGTEQGNIQQVQAGYFTLWAADTGSLIGFNEYTGVQAWTCQITKNTYGNIGINTNYGYEGQIATVGYGNLYIAPEDGYMHCVNMTTGTETWATPTAPGGFQMPQPNFPIAANNGYMHMPCLADGKIFFTTGKEHEVNPYYQQHVLYCLNAYTGVQEWNETGNWGVEAIADGVLLGVNPYTGFLSGIARGQSLTTVTAPQDQITAGNQVVIQGTITDQSPALLGTPCMADSCMTQWMDYKLFDQPFPSNARGVPMVITTMDPNGNFVSIGNATSDSSGNYHFTWTPPNVPGTYTVTATLNPTNSYYGSSAETTMVIVGPSTHEATPTATPTSVADMYFVPAIAGIIVVVIIGFIVLALLMLRKRP